MKKKTIASFTLGKNQQVKVIEYFLKNEVNAFIVTINNNRALKTYSHEEAMERFYRIIETYK